ncbi:MAG: right-handed parallel beta-helix repeat-containing protein, partial [Proteobacteria bacterium]
SWTIRQNELAYNDGGGVEVGSGTKVIGNKVHHNAQVGYGCRLYRPQTALPILLDSNEFAFNNYQDKYEPGFEAGGGKITQSNYTVVTHNYTHDNHGPGLWDDIDNRNITYSYNLAENNDGGGIFHEIGYNASIHHNVLKNNGRVWAGWLWNAGIQISSSGGEAGGLIEIYENTVVTNAVSNGIGIMQQNRDADPCSYGRCLVQNIYVHHNTVDISKGGTTGVAQDTGDNAIFTSRNVKLDYNTYIMGSNPSPFHYNNQQGPKSLFQNAGQELHGVFK